MHAVSRGYIVGAADFVFLVRFICEIWQVLVEVVFLAERQFWKVISVGALTASFRLALLCQSRCDGVTQCRRVDRKLGQASCVQRRDMSMSSDTLAGELSRDC